MIAILCVTLLIPLRAQAMENPPYLVVLHYKDIGGDADGSVSMEEFIKHLEILKKDGRQVLSFHLAENFLKNAKPGEIGYIISVENLTPANMPAIYEAVKEVGMSYLAFLKPEDWSDLAAQKYLRDKVASGYAVYALTLSSPVLNEKEFQVELNKAVSDYRDIFSIGADYFLFPEGLYDEAMLDVVKNYDFEVLIGGAQGMATAEDNIWPRYDVTYLNADLNRFRELLDIKPLHVTDKTPGVTLVKDAEPKVGFTLDEPIKNRDNLRCFLQGNGAQEVTYLSDKRVQIHPKLEEAGRKYYMNCILRIDEKGGGYTYKWLGFILQPPEVVEEEGRDLEENEPVSSVSEE